MEVTYTIIIPHYNIPDLLVRCLKSIPVREDIQVIVVDDCSPDFDSYKERYPELSRPYLELYQTPQGGSAGRARNIGLQHARGRWILFADSDDFFAPNMYELMSSHRNDDADAIFFKADSVDTVTLEPSDRHHGRNDSIDAYLAGTHTCAEAILKHTVVWATMYSAKLLRDNNITFEEILCGNDMMFAIKAANLCQNPLFCNEALYVITYRRNSLNDNKQKNYRSHVVYREVYARLDRYCKLNNISHRWNVCVPGEIHQTFKQYGMQAALYHTSLAIKDGALFYGLTDALRRKIFGNR